MKVMLLAYEAPEDFALRDDKEKLEPYMGAWYAFSQAMTKAGVKGDSAALDAPSTATVVSVRDGVREVQDGPYPDTKEQLGGFMIVDVTHMKEAVEWAGKCPASVNGFVDARPILDLGQGDEQ
ncbi:MAG: hypothetical protein JKX88_00065 [Marinicaulis sp.]|nr:hypothetical protein [Marinicaulis sp.]